MPLEEPSAKLIPLLATMPYGINQAPKYSDHIDFNFLFLHTPEMKTH